MSIICKHFGICGGCSFQDISYSEQLLNKKESIQQWANAFGITCTLKPVNFFPEWYYRNKMEFTFGGDLAATCGMYRKDSKREIFDIEECLIFSKDLPAIISAVRNFVRSKNYTAYNKFTYKGFLRNLLVRQTKFTASTMIGIVTTSQIEFDKEGFLQALLSLKLQAPIKSVYRITNDSWSDFIVFEKKELLFGEPSIEESLDAFKFKIGVDSFFQVNPVGVKALYGKIRQYAALTGKEHLLDLFCGAGGIGMFLADTADSVIGVELEEPVVNAARHNSDINNIKNMTFFAMDARKYLNGPTKPSNIDIVIMNPPRPGVSNKVKRAVIRLNPKTIFYSSCNPETLCRDLKDLSSRYKPAFLEPFDFFPHTKHVECLAMLERLV